MLETLTARGTGHSCLPGPSCVRTTPSTSTGFVTWTGRAPNCHRARPWEEPSRRARTHRLLSTETWEAAVSSFRRENQLRLGNTRSCVQRRRARPPHPKRGLGPRPAELGLQQEGTWDSAAATQALAPPSAHTGHAVLEPGPLASLASTLSNTRATAQIHKPTSVKTALEVGNHYLNIRYPYFYCI